MLCRARALHFLFTTAVQSRTFYFTLGQVNDGALGLRRTNQNGKRSIVVVKGTCMSHKKTSQCRMAQRCRGMTSPIGMTWVVYCPQKRGPVGKEEPCVMRLDMLDGDSGTFLGECLLLELCVGLVNTCVTRVA